MKVKLRRFGNPDSRVLVGIPISKDREAESEKVAKVHLARAGMDCEVILIIQEDGWDGWVELHNWAARNLDFDHYVFSCGDYFPSRDYLRVAYDLMIQTGHKLIAFNDGKWDGFIATAGLIERKWMETNYEGDLFYPGYKKHYADTELSMIALGQEVIGYCPDAVLIEIDYGKFEKGYIHKIDQLLFLARKESFKSKGMIKEDVLEVYG